MCSRYFRLSGFSELPNQPIRGVPPPTELNICLSAKFRYASIRKQRSPTRGNHGTGDSCLLTGFACTLQHLLCTIIPFQVTGFSPLTTGTLSERIFGCRNISWSQGLVNNLSAEGGGQVEVGPRPDIRPPPFRGPGKPLDIRPPPFWPPADIPTSTSATLESWMGMAEVEVEVAEVEVEVGIP